MTTPAVKQYSYTGDVALSLFAPDVGEVKVVPAGDDQKATVLSDWEYVPAGEETKVWYLATQPNWTLLKGGKSS